MRKKNYYFLIASMACMSSIAAVAAPPTTVTTSPQGTVKTYSKSSDSYYRISSGKETPQDVTGAYAEWVFADDGKVYMKDPITSFTFDSYLTGQLSDNKIVFEMPQPIGTTQGVQLYVARMNCISDWTGIYYEPDQGGTVEFNIEDDGTIRIADYGILPYDDAYGVHQERAKVALGIVYYQSGRMVNYIHSDSNIVFTPIANDPITELPSGLTAAPWAMNSDNGVPQTVSVATSGSDIYMTPFPDKYPGVYVKGTINGDKAVFPGNQFLGHYTASTPDNDDQKSCERAAFFSPMSKNVETYTLLPELEFSFSPSQMSASGIMAINCGQVKADYQDGFENPSLSYQGSDITFADPKSPDIKTAMPRLDTLGYGYVIFDLSPYDVNGNLYDTNAAYYTLYVDGEEYRFDRNQYPGLPSASQTRIAYNYSDDTHILAQGSQRTIHFFFEETPRLGIKVTFTDPNGMVHESAIAEINLAEVFPAGIEYTNAQLHQTETWGSGKLEDYNVAIQLKDASLVGKTVTGVKVPVIEDENLEYTIWLSKVLDAEFKNGKYEKITDIVEIPVLPQSGYLYAKFPEPYEIDDDGIYVGYSIKVKALTETTKSPLLVTKEIVTGGFMLQSSRSYIKWADQGGTRGVTLAMSAIIDGTFYDNAAGVYYVNDIDSEPDLAGQTTVTVANHGLNAVNSVDYTWNVAGLSGEGSFTFPTPIAAAYNRKGAFTLDIPAISEADSHPLTVNITKVNGVENIDAMSSGLGYVNILNEEPLHRAVLEEYTGTWCGWCPRGLVGLNMMNDKYPDTFIGISYHQGDPMEMAQGIPGMAPAFPAAWMDRMVDTDAYQGRKAYTFGVDEVWLERCAVVAPCHVTAKAQWMEGRDNYIEVSCETRFVKTVRDEYRIAYVVIADGLKGATSDWLQANSYAGKTEWLTCEGLEDYVNAPSLAPNMIYNDVAVYSSGHYGIAGSLDDTTPFENRTHVYEICTDFAVNKKGEPIIQNPDNLKVVAMVIRFPRTDMGDVSEYGEIVNADICKVDGTGSVDELDNASEIVSEVYYDLAGHVISARPSVPGIYVKKIVFADGNEASQKVVVK